jgi:large subunit ribosomal protein L25
MVRKIPVVKAQTRDRFGKGEMHRLRDEGKVPGVVYGPDEETVSLMVDAKEMLLLLKHVSIENTIVDLDLSGEVKKKYKTLIREVQRHPFKEVLRHIDFYCVPKGRKISVQVPIVLHGTPIGVAQQGGIVQHALRELEIMVLPTNIPEHIVVDISGLNIHDSIHVADLKDEGFEVLSDEHSSIISVVPPVVITEPTEDEEELAEGELAEDADDKESEE